jgi:hypothetical protein
MESIKLTLLCCLILFKHERGPNMEILKLVEDYSSLCYWKYAGYSRKDKIDLILEYIE